MSEFRRISSYALAYVLWAASLILAGLVLLQLRESYLSAAAMSTFNRLQGNQTELFYAALATRAFDTWSYLLIGVIEVIAIVFIEFYYRTGAHLGRLRQRFVLVTAIEFVLLFIANMTNVVLIWQVSSFTWKSLFYPVLELLTAGIFTWLWFDLRRLRLATTTEGPPA